MKKHAATTTQLIAELYEELERIGEQNPELYDTDVRDQLFEALVYYFVWANPLEQAPCCYGMFSAKGDREVSRVVSKFLRAATSAAAAEGLQAKARHQELQNPAVVTRGNHRYDDFIGHSNETPKIDRLPGFRFTTPEY